MGVGLQDGAVHEGAGVALVGVADDILLSCRRLRDRRPLEAGRVAAAAASAQTAGRDLAQHVGRCHLAECADQRRVAADRDIALEAVGVDDPGMLEDDLLLTREEGLIGGTTQTLERRPVEAGNDVRCIGRGDVTIEDGLLQGRVAVGDRHQRAGRAESHAADPLDLAGGSRVAERRAQCVEDGLGAGRLTARRETDAHLALHVGIDPTVLGGEIGEIVEIHQLSSSSLAMSDSESSLPSTSPSTTTAGARPQAPTQRAVSSDSRSSSVVPPGSTS